MNEEQQAADDNEPISDAANNEVGPTEKLREPDKSEGDFSAPGAQDPANEEIKEEKGPNTE